ncbi:MAG: hypothetical protein R3Y29_05445 [bacterium]
MNEVLNQKNLDYFYNLHELNTENPEFVLWNLFQISGNIEDFLIYKEFQNIYNNF